MGNQIFAAKKAGEPTDSLQYFFEKLEAVEKDIVKYIKKEVNKTDIWKKYFKGVKGIGPILAGAFISTVDIARAEHASSLWKFCGLHVDLETGKAARLKKGVKCDWNPFLKKTCWLAGQSFIKTKGKYRTIYDTSKEFYQRKFPLEVKEGKRTNYTKMHIHNMAIRRATKLFLAELYQEWRTMENLPVSVPFQHRGLE